MIKVFYTQWYLKYFFFLFQITIHTLQSHDGSDCKDIWDNGTKYDCHSVGDEGGVNIFFLIIINLQKFIKFI